MLTILRQGVLADGRKFKVVRFSPPGDCPTSLISYLMGSMGLEKYRGDYHALAYWRLDYRERLAGHYLEHVTDHFYQVQVEDVWAARLWFGFNRKTGRGNFGNVFTEPEYRKLGLFGLMMEYCVADFYADPAAKMLCCYGDNRFIIKSYQKNGFQLIYGGETGPMTWMKPNSGTDFHAEVTAAYDGTSAIAKIRPGHCGDQFDCDKFLAYSRAVYEHPRIHRVGPAASIQDFRIAYQETLSGRGVIETAENERGAVVGYAFALDVFGCAVLDFTLHFGYLAEAEKLLRPTVKRFGETFPGRSLYCAIAATDLERLEAVRQSGFHQTALLPNALTCGDMVILQAD